MSWLNFLFPNRPPKRTASLAKERLQVIVAHERTQRGNPEILEQLQKEIMAVIAKYTAVDPSQVKVQLDKQGGRATLELNVDFGDDAAKAKKNATKQTKTTSTKNKDTSEKTAETAV